ncbi:restriction endonuclease subunit S [Limnovirga soli]|uniref:Restriction endonuclease subunit S n=1 Tax=Limnovirga soli TaxID=2656915 RepID=A0A8J8JQQ8_9BACT|nr:restriction endonuclease subunit S [Limnovirga soli]NNV55007.1 restriction endonuclease subunit S [Limnovirga soli]
MDDINKILPKDWKWLKLGEVCNTTSGGTPSRRESKYYDGNIPWVKSGELDRGVITDTEEKISEDAIKNSSAKIFPKGTLLIALYGATIGKLAFLGVDAATNQAICGIFQNEKISSAFLYNYLFFKKRKLIGQGIGGAQPNISQTILKNLDIPLPPKPTQETMVSKIEELFSELDKGMENLRTAQQQLKTYRQSVLKWAFEGKLTNENVKEGELPKGWKEVLLKDVCKIIGGVTKGKDFKGKETIHLPYLRVANVQDGYLDLNEIKLIEILPSDKGKYQLLFGDILYTEGGDKDKLGRGTIWKNEIEDCIHQNHIFRARPLSNEVASMYIAYFSQTRVAKSYFFKHGKQTTNLASINLTILSNLPIPLCAFKEQNKIVQEIESRLSVADKMEESITQSLQQAEALRQSILKKAFEGKLI